MPASDTQVDVTVFDRQRYYRPGDQIRGQVSVTANGKSLSFAALRLVWAGRIMTQLAGQLDRKEYFNQVFHLDPTTDAFAAATDLQSPGTMLQVTDRASFPFEVTVPTDLTLPSSFQVDDPMVGALATVEYVLEVSLDHQTFDPMPVKTRTMVDVLAYSFPPLPDAQQQQTSERTYLSTVLQERAEYRTAARVTVPCKLASRGAVVPVVAHIWHDCKYTRQNGVSMTLVRMCRINCGERTEVLTKELAIVTRDLNLQLRQGYSVQTLTESLQVPFDITPTIPIECGVLAAVEYRVFLAVHAHPGALYTELPSTSTTAATQYMLVEIPLYVDVQQEQPQPQQQYYESSKTVDERPTVPPKDAGKMKDRMKGMFRRRSKMEPMANNNDSSVSLSNKSGSIRQVMSTFRPRNGKTSSPPASISSGRGPSTHVPTSPALSATSSVTDVSKRPQQSTSSQTSTPSSPSFLPPPPAYVESAPAPAPIKPASASSLPPPPLARAASIQQKDLPTINPVHLRQPAPPKEHNPIPGLEGGGVYTFHMFDDSDDEEPGPVSVSNNVVADDAASNDMATTVTNDSNVRYFDMFPDSDDEGPAVQRQAVRANAVYPDPVNKLDEVSESESDHDDSDEESDDLLSIVKRREDRIERAKVRSKK